MNPLFLSFNAPKPAPLPAAPIVDEAPMPAELSPAASYDRAYIAAHGRCFHHNPEIVTYDRSPLPGEWSLMPNGAFVRVFVINEFTTVRVLHTTRGDRITEPVIDSWRGFPSDEDTDLYAD